MYSAPAFQSKIASVPNPKFASFCSTRPSELRIRKDTSNYRFQCGFGSQVRKRMRCRNDADLRTTTLGNNGYAIRRWARIPMSIGAAGPAAAASGA